MHGNPINETAPTVFVVDDDPAIGSSLTQFIEPSGFTVEVFGAARTFLSACDSSRHGCTLLDIRIPDMCGLDVQDVLHARAVYLPVIMLTGYGETGTAVRAMKKGAFDFLEKPIPAQVLLERIQRAVEHDAVQRKRYAERSLVDNRLHLLTPRERQVFQGVVAGMANKRIAGQLGISEKTVEVHRARVMEKTRARHVPDLVRMAFIALES